MRSRSVLLFPEGTRSGDGVVRPFKKGGLVLAIQAQMPVVPVALCHTRSIAGAKIEAFKAIEKCDVRLVVGKPISTVGMAFEDRDKLAATLHAEVVRLKTLWESKKGAELGNAERAET
ncbi:hypothetical protein T484DRAFT_1854141 [Baffinella frigidus]|nr:hypothetical protein T484DRAFT_1854141 [Cryptophyta sp. CCMP2293]